MDVQQVRRRNEHLLLGKPNVNGVGTGKDEAGRDVILVFVSRKLPRTALAPQDLLPRELDGYAVNVVETGPFTSQ